MVTMAVPVESPNGMRSNLSDHFGMASDFALFDYDGGRFTGLRFVQNDTTKRDAPSNAQFLADCGAQVVLAGSIGPHMLAVLFEKGVRVFDGAVGTLEDVIEDYKAGMLTEVRSTG